MAKSPSEHMISISEEQSTRKQHHLKSGSLPELRLHKATTAFQNEDVGEVKNFCAQFKNDIDEESRQDSTDNQG